MNVYCCLLVHKSIPRTAAVMHAKHMCTRMLAAVYLFTNQYHSVGHHLYTCHGFLTQKRALELVKVMSWNRTSERPTYLHHCNQAAWR